MNYDDHVYLIDYGLATKFVDTNGDHRPFCMDQRRAHDGTLEFTSRDAHFGTHSRRSDLECFGYNLIYWCEGYLPWKDEKLKEQPELVHRLKEVFMTDVREMLKLLYGKEIEKFIGDYMQYVGQLEFDEEPDYNYLRGLFEKEFLKLGYKKSEMRMNLSELHKECEPIDKNITEHDLMMSRITDLKTVTKLGFLVTTVDNVDGTETLAKPNDSLSLNMSSKASPKNLRSKEKNGSKLLPKQRQRKLAEKQIITEKMAKGKKLSIHEISLLDPDAIARDRADKEYEKFDDKMQTPQRYVGNPTYAILEIENRLKTKHGVSTPSTTVAEVEPIKGYTKPMMEILKKQQMAVEQQLNCNSPITQSRSREGLRNVIKPTQKNLTYQKQRKKKKSKRKNASSKQSKKVVEESVPTPLTSVSSYYKPKRGRPRKHAIVPAFTPQTIREEEEEETREMSVLEEDSRGSSSRTAQNNNKITRRGRPRKIMKVVAELPETEDDSVYYDIPGEEEAGEESSSDGIKEISDLDMEVDDDDDDVVQNQEPLIDSDDEVLKPKRQRKQFVSHSEDNSNHGSTSSSNALRRGGRRGRYENDDDFEAFSEEASNVSSATQISMSTVASSFKPRRVRGGTSRDSGIATRNKIKSRSTSRSAAISVQLSDRTDQSEVSEGSEFEAESDIDESEEGIDYDQDEEENVSDDDEEEEEERSDESELDDDSDSIDIKYSPIKTRHARRRINYMNVKQMRELII